MQIDKSQVIELLESKGETDKVAQAQAELPEQVDPEQHADLLVELGIDPQELLGGLGGLGGLG
jgi:hypothetical protein